jgi:hypothetical protein
MIIFPFIAQIEFITKPPTQIRLNNSEFGDDPAYGKSKAIFPEISKLVFDRMINSNP